MNDAVDVNGLRQALQQYATLYEGLVESIKPIQINETMTKLAKQFSTNLKAMESIKPIQVNAAMTELARQISINSKTLESFDSADKQK